MSTSNMALLVIDAQESFRHRPYWRDCDLAGFIDRLQLLVDSSRAHGIPIVQVFHVEEKGGILSGVRLCTDAGRAFLYT